MSNSIPLPLVSAGVFPSVRRWSTALAVALSLAACADLPVSPIQPTVSHPATEVDAAPAPAPAPAAFRGASLWVDPLSPVRRTIREWSATRPADAAMLEKIARQPVAVWLGDWNPEPYAEVHRLTRAITSSGSLPVFVLYNIPKRDCGQFSAGGTESPAAYARWVSEVARGLGDSRAAVLLEPDGLALMDCLSTREQEIRFQMIRDAVATLTRSGQVSVYLDAGHPGWHGAEAIGKRLLRGGIEKATGFFLNVAHFRTTDESIRYGTSVSAVVGGKHFVIDTGRNGLGPAAGGDWCNPAGRALGTPPTTNTGNPLVDAFLWIKTPGESDGECNGGPSAGRWWPEYAVGLASRTSW